MRSLVVWLRAQPGRLHALLWVLVTGNVVALFFLPRYLGLALQITSLLVALVFVRAYRRAGVS